METATLVGLDRRDQSDPWAAYRKAREASGRIRAEADSIRREVERQASCESDPARVKTLRRLLGLDRETFGGRVESARADVERRTHRSHREVLRIVADAMGRCETLATACIASGLPRSTFYRVAAQLEAA